LTRDDLEAMREEFGAGERDDGGLPYDVDDDLRQMRLAEQTRLNPERWAEARGVCHSRMPKPSAASSPKAHKGKYVAGVPRGSGLYSVLGRAFLTPLLALLRFCYPTPSVALRFAPLKHCAGASVVRP
jgi:hypothetical protein